MKEPLNSNVAADKERLSTADLIRPLYMARGWMHGLGILSIGIGIILLPLIGYMVMRGRWELSSYFVVGIVSIWQGTLLFSSAKATLVAYRFDNDYALVAALAYLGTWLKTIGWMIVAKLVLDVMLYLVRAYAM